MVSFAFYINNTQHKRCNNMKGTDKRFTSYLHFLSLFW